MTKELTRGGNALLGAAGAITASLRIDGDVGADVDCSLYLLDQRGQVTSDAGMIFYNQPRSDDGSVRLDQEPRGWRISIDVSTIAREIEKVAVAITADQPIGRLPRIAFGAQGENGKAIYAVADLGNETALIIAELYRHASGWKVRAVGQGYDSGLAAMARSFGVDVLDEGDLAPRTPAPAAPETLAPPLDNTPISAPPRIVPPPIAEATSFPHPADRGPGEVLLDRRAQKAAVTLGRTPLSVKLGWRSKGRAVSLHAYWLAKDGRVGVARHDPDRSDGASMISVTSSVIQGVEELTLRNVGELAHVAIAAYSAPKTGPSSFRAAGVHVVVDNGEGQTIRIELEDEAPFSCWSSPALRDLASSGEARVIGVQRYGKPFCEKQPSISRDGSVLMDAGSSLRNN